MIERLEPGGDHLLLDGIEIIHLHADVVEATQPVAVTVPGDGSCRRVDRHVGVIRADMKGMSTHF